MGGSVDTVMDTILIVDGEPFEVSLLEGMLEGEGYRFETASAGEEAKSVIERQGSNIATILLDWVLPDVDGLELLRWIKSQSGLDNVEVIVESAEFVPENVKAGIDCGAYYYLTKPFDERQLEAIVRAAVSSYKLKCRIASKVEDTIDAFGLLQSGTFHFRTFSEAELLAVHIASACGQPNAGLGLHELLINAVEHGNLGITYREKGQLLADKKLAAERARRLSLPDYRNRRVRVDLRRVSDQMEVTITDEGSGFDFKKFFQLDESRLFDTHGRGVLMASSTLDVEYEQPGNCVHVRVPIQA